MHKFFFYDRTKNYIYIHKQKYSHQPVAYYNALPQRKEIPSARRCASDSPDAAPRVFSSLPTSPAIPGPVAVSPSGARPAAKRFVVQERISPYAPFVSKTMMTTITDGITTTTVSNGGVGIACRLSIITEYDDNNNNFIKYKDVQKCSLHVTSIVKAINQFEF